MRIRITTLTLFGTFVVLATALLTLGGALEAAHRSWAIQYFSSDGAAYFEQYQELWADVTLRERPIILLTGMPIVFMKLTDGNLLQILAGNLLVMAITLKAALDCLPTMRARLLFLVGSLAFPYFLFGFLSLNKEVYAMCSAIFFGTYWLRGKGTHLAASLILAFAARYYMLVAMLFLFFVFPRDRRPRYWLIVATLIVISVAAPFVKALIPGYSSSDLLEGAGITQIWFSRGIDAHLYALLYPIKYLVLLPGRIYSLAIGLGRPADPMEGVVSLLTLVLLPFGAYIALFARSGDRSPRALALMALVAPVPIMWTEIGHWRYFSYVYFFLLFAVILYVAERRQRKRAPLLSPPAAMQG